MNAGVIEGGELADNIDQSDYLISAYTLCYAKRNAEIDMELILDKNDSSIL